jgi:uncharacterized protein (UPF0276 family)
MLGLGYRSEMGNWDLSQLPIQFIEIAPENWMRRDIDKLMKLNLPIACHGVSLNLGGTAPLDKEFVRDIRHFLEQLDGVPLYSDHLASTGGSGHLYDLFPVAQTSSEIIRISDRIKEVQDILGHSIAIENPTAYVCIGDIPDPVFLQSVAERANCNILLDLNNIVVNFKNHGLINPIDYLQQIDYSRITYCHVAGHYWNEEFQFYIDSHSRHVDEQTMQLLNLVKQPKLLEWDNHIPDINTIREELCKISSHM